LHMIRKLGTFVEFSVMSEKAAVDWTIIGDTKELNIRGAHLGPHCYPVAISMLERRMLPMDSIVTHRFPLTDFAHAMDRVATHHGSMKVILVP
jgi:erythritol/L-threitol dehydrogenase